MAEELPYGTWRSTVSARTVAITPQLGPVAIGTDGAIWWEETRPEEDGRVHVMRAAATEPAVGVLVQPGGPTGVVDSWLPLGGDLVVGYADGRLRLLSQGERPQPLVSERAGS